MAGNGTIGLEILDELPDVESVLVPFGGGGLSCGIAAGGAGIFAGFIILLSSAVNALAPYLPPNMAAWLAPLIDGLVIIIIGYIIYASGKSALDASNLKPSRTVASLQQDGQLVKEHVQ